MTKGRLNHEHVTRALVESLPKGVPEAVGRDSAPHSRDLAPVRKPTSYVPRGQPAALPRREERAIAALADPRL